jgi:NADH-quinone oxidoreductase subunit M
MDFFLSIIQAIAGFVREMFIAPTPAYWVGTILISLAIGVYVWALLLRKEDQQRQVWGTVLAVLIPFLLLLVLISLAARDRQGNLVEPNLVAQWPILSLVTFLPLLGAIVVLCLPKDRHDWIKWVSLLVCLFPLVLSIVMWVSLDGMAPIAGCGGLKFCENSDWIDVPSVGLTISYKMGVDGISVPLVFLTTLLTTLAVLYSFIIKDRPKEYFAFFLLLEMAMIGVFVSLNFFLFYIFWELSLVPMYFLIGLWGAPPRQEGRIVRGGPYAAMKFFIYTLVGSIGLLIAILAIFFQMQSVPAFAPGAAEARNALDIVDLTQWVAQGNSIFPVATLGAGLVFWAMFVGFAIKVPSFPFHTWLPDAHVEAPTAGSVILAGILLKLGAYGLIRILLPLMPGEFSLFGPVVVILATISIVYGALVAMAQWDLKKLIAYSSVNHMGLVTLGVAIAAMAGGTLPSQAGPLALSGAVLQMFNHGIITGGLFFLVGIIYERVHTRDLHIYGGLRRLIPVFAGIWGVTCFASLGLPALAGFVSEFMVFQGSFGAALQLVGSSFQILSPMWVLILVAISTLGIIFGAAFMLWTIQRTLFGTAKEKFQELHEEGHLRDMDLREVVTMAPLLAFMVAIGVYPMFIVDMINKAATALLR